ncbi:MAG: hypothetical protein Q4F99_02645 [bacterium]|nr:hypothetical protein [bacterium]
MMFSIATLGALLSLSIPLGGDWKVTLPDQDPVAITLPATLGDAQLGPAAQEAVYGALTLKHQFVGAATYTRTFTISPTEANVNYELFLERVLWKSTVTLDGKTLGSCDSLATPHVYTIPAGALTAGEHTLSITVDNSLIHPIGEKAHSYGDAMQTRWNGILGKIELRPVNPLREARLFTPWPLEHVSEWPTFTIELPQSLYKNPTFVARGLDGLKVKIVEWSASPTNPEERCLVKLAVKSEVQPWSPANPSLYMLKLQAMGQEQIFRFGFRTLARKGNKLFLNGEPFFIRGNLENCHFPLTGYPVMDKEGWKKIIQAQKDEGANQLRFHTWCPPQAAFDAADELGMMLSPEAGIWIDGWMTKDFPYLKGLGKGPAAVDEFVQNELRRILDAYGNAPCFLSLSIGNELGSSDFNKLGEWMDACKTYDSRRLYAASTARQITKADDFLVTHAYPGLGMIRERLQPGTNWDYEGAFSKTALPTIAHEIGQWPVYPNFDAEIPKYTGILRPWNLENLRAASKKAGVLRFVPDFARVSLKTNRLVYKAEIESFLRTPSCAGISLLGIQDYSGQGEALIGWLDSFYDTKPGAEAMVPVIDFFNDTVCLARFDKDIWTSNETLKVSFYLYNYGPAVKEDIPWTFAGQSGTLHCDVPTGTVTKVGEMSFPLDKVAAPSQQTLTFGKNRWSLWVYPQSADVTIPKDIVYATDYPTALSAAKEGKAVLFNAAHSGNPKMQVFSAFKPVYWSTTWFPGQRATTLGMLIQDKSPAFASFPTEDWQDWQWYYLINAAKTFKLDGLSGTFAPLAMPVVDFHKPQLAGALFEVNLGKGRILVSGFNLDMDRPEARQLKASLLKYVASGDFKPTETVCEKWFAGVLAPPQMNVAPRPEEYENAVAYIECAAFLTEKHTDVPHSKARDRAELVSGSYSVTGSSLRTWSDADGSYWVGNEIKVVLSGIANVRGKILVRFRDPNNNKRTSTIQFEHNRSAEIPLHAQNEGGCYWQTFPVDMEDFLDGKLELTIKKTTGPNVMIDRVIVIPN